VSFFVTEIISIQQEAMKNANELIEEEERDRKKAEKRRAKKKVLLLFFNFIRIQRYKFIT